MVPLLLRDLARAGTVTCAMAHAAGALRALPGHVDGGAAAPGDPDAHSRACHGKRTPASRLPALAKIFRERDHPR
jgi:hypothetical protein